MSEFDYIVEDLAFYEDKLWSLEHAELDGRATDLAEIERTKRLCRRRIRDILSRPQFEPQCRTHAPGPALGWAHPDNENRLS